MVYLKMKLDCVHVVVDAMDNVVNVVAVGTIVIDVVVVIAIYGAEENVLFRSIAFSSTVRHFLFAEEEVVLLSVLS